MDIGAVAGNRSIRSLAALQKFHQGIDAVDNWDIGQFDQMDIPDDGSADMIQSIRQDNMHTSRLQNHPSRVSFLAEYSRIRQKHWKYLNLLQLTM